MEWTPVRRLRAATRNAAIALLTTTSDARRWLSMRGRHPIQYDDPLVATLVRRKTLRFLKHNIPYPRSADTDKLLDELGQKETRVLDLGGAFGYHYHAVKAAAPDAVVKWAVVEQPSFVSLAEELTEPTLNFFTSMDDAAQWLGSVDIFHSSGTLFCMPHWRMTAQTALSYRAQCAVWFRMRMSPTKEGVPEIRRTLLSEHGPGTISKPFNDEPVEVRMVRIPEPEFIELHGMAGYQIVSSEGPLDARSLIFRRQR